jgi:hypothetical protein
MEVMVKGPGSTGEIKYFLAHLVQHVLNSVDYVGTVVVMQHDDTSCQHTRTLSVDSGARVSDSFTAVLYINDVRVAVQ